MLTPKQVRALQVIRDHGPIRPYRFGQKLWPAATWAACGSAALSATSGRIGVTVASTSAATC